MTQLNEFLKSVTPGAVLKWASVIFVVILQAIFISALVVWLASSY